MRIKKTSHIPYSDLTAINYDMIIAASGYETRSRFFCETINLKCDNKFALSFCNHKNIITRKQNDLVFESNNFKLIELSGNDEIPILELLNTLVDNNKEVLNILVDYSSMTRIWYAAILKFIHNNSFKAQKVNLIFVYSFSEFVLPPEKKIYNRYVGPIEGFYQISIPYKPTAIIIGLGYVKERAFGLSEYFDVEPHLFIAKRAEDQEFYLQVMKNNKSLIKHTVEENIFYYSLDNLIYTETMLSHLCQELNEKFRIVLAPCGPKPFTLICLVTALRNNFVDVWRISAGEDDEVVDKKPTGEFLIYNISFDTAILK